MRGGPGRQTGRRRPRSSYHARPPHDQAAVLYSFINLVLLQQFPEIAMYVIGNAYNRVRDIHEKLGGQRYGGISTPTNSPYVILFTGEAGEAYGYADGWDSRTYLKTE